MITAILAKIFTRKNIGYIILVVLLLLLIASGIVGYLRITKLHAENVRLKQNQNAFITGFDSTTTQQLEFTTKEFKKYMVGQQKILDSLNLKIDHITEVQEFSSVNFSHGSGRVTNNTYIVNQNNLDSLVQYLRDSLLINITKEQLSNMDSISIHKAPFKTNGCIEGTANWIGANPDSVFVETQQLIDLTFFGNKKKNKGWFWRDVARFFTFRWKQIGSDKWDNYITVYNKCGGDSSQVINNKKINVIKTK